MISDIPNLFEDLLSGNAGLSGYQSLSVRNHIAFMDLSTPGHNTLNCEIWSEYQELESRSQTTNQSLYTTSFNAN